MGPGNGWHLQACSGSAGAAAGGWPEEQMVARRMVGHSWVKLIRLRLCQKRHELTRPACIAMCTKHSDFRCACRTPQQHIAHSTLHTHTGSVVLPRRYWYIHRATCRWQVCVPPAALTLHFTTLHDCMHCCQHGVSLVYLCGTCHVQQPMMCWRWPPPVYVAALGALSQHGWLG